MEKGLGLTDRDVYSPNFNTKMKTIEQILELIKLNAYSGTPENIQSIVELVNEAQKQALRLSSVVVIKGMFCRCECEMPKLDGRKGLCGKCELPIVL